MTDPNEETREITADEILHAIHAARTAPAIVQFNVSKMRFPWTDERFDSFRDLLRHVHAQVEEAPGFIDRMRGEDFDEGYIAPYRGYDVLRIDGVENDLIMGNVSKWASRHELHDFTFGNEAHLEMFRRRGEWFLPWSLGTSHYVMWFEKPHSSTTLVQDMPLPGEMSIQEARIRLAALNTWGPDPRHFTWEYQF